MCTLQNASGAPWPSGRRGCFGELVVGKCGVHMVFLREPMENRKS